MDITVNTSATTHFLLLEFSQDQDLQTVHFFLFLTLYLVTVTGNLLIIFAIVFHHHLQTPAYFFLMNLAIMNLGTISVTVPKSVVNSFLNTRLISYSGCVAQVFFQLFFVGSDFALLTVMAYDRYVAICNPLHYKTIMNKTACIQMVASVWISSLLYGVVHTGSTFANSFCSNLVEQYFCEIPKLIKLSCNNFYLVEFGILVVSFSVAFGCFIFMIVTYVRLFVTVLRMPSVQGRQKAFSTCLPHITVTSLSVFTAILAYWTRPSNSSLDLSLVFAVIYSVVPPMMNPFIYSLRNKEIKLTVCKILNMKVSSKKLLF